LNSATPMNVTDVVAAKVLEFNDHTKIQLHTTEP
jgi:hypothetical protein